MASWQARPRITPGGQGLLRRRAGHRSFPVPWGVRTDGESLWAIRRTAGWSWASRSPTSCALLQLGWEVRKHVSEETHLGVIFEARRANGRYPRAASLCPPTRTAPGRVRKDPLGRSSASAASEADHPRTGARSTERWSSTSSTCPPWICPTPSSTGGTTSGGRCGGLGAQGPGAVRPRCDPARVGCETWCPSELLGTSDDREIGLGVRSITLCRS